MNKNTATQKEWCDRVKELMLSQYYLSPSDYDYDSDNNIPSDAMQAFYNDGSTPEEFVEWNGDKYNLIKFD
jgi:hypothetical protein